MLGPWWGAAGQRRGDASSTASSRRAPARPTPQGCKLSNAEPPTTTPRGALQRRVRRGGRHRAAGGPGRARARRDARDERRGRGAQHARPPGRQEELIQAIKATGKPLVVVLFNGRPLTLERHRRRLAGDPRGVVPRRAGRPCRRRRRLRQRQPGRQAAGDLPAAAGPGADLLQPRADGPTLQPGREVRLAPPRHPELRAAVRVRIRPQLHDVRGHQPPAELVDACRAMAA